MIRYRLQCKKDHQFEGWFKSSDDYTRQAKRGLVECPTCGSKKVSKALMSPSITKGRSRGKPARTESQTSSDTLPAPEAGTQSVAAHQQRELMRLMRKVRDEVLAKSEYVGPRFAEEARKIHLNEAEARGIHGEASPEEVRKLKEEGVEVHPVPVLPDDHN